MLVTVMTITLDVLMISSVDVTTPCDVVGGGDSPALRGRSVEEAGASRV